MDFKQEILNKLEQVKECINKLEQIDKFSDRLMVVFKVSRLKKQIAKLEKRAANEN